MIRILPSLCLCFELSDQSFLSLCFDLSDAVAYDISIIDNVTGEEVAAFAGRGCETQIEKTLKEALKPFL